MQPAPLQLAKLDVPMTAAFQGRSLVKERALIALRSTGLERCCCQDVFVFRETNLPPVRPSRRDLPSYPGNHKSGASPVAPLFSHGPTPVLRGRRNHLPLRLGIETDVTCYRTADETGINKLADSPPQVLRCRWRLR
jgi:hypothetical protein